MRIHNSFAMVGFLCATIGLGCSSSDGDVVGSGGTGNLGGFGNTAVGGATTSSTNVGGATGKGGSTGTGGSVTGGSTSKGGGSSGGASGKGGAPTGGVGSGGKAVGGASGSGGAQTGGAGGKGGTTTGGSATGGSATGGSATGGSATGGSATGGTSSNGGSTNCTDTSTFTTNFSTRYAGANIPVTGKSKTYRVTTNWWHKFTDQTVNVNQIGFSVGNPSNVSVPATDGAPIGYPAIYIGSYTGNATVDSNLPKQVSALTTVPTIFDTNATSLDTSNLNAAYDVWFTATGTPLPSSQSNPGRGGAYLMVWLFDPSQRQPRGRNQHPAHTVNGVPGTWDVWIDNTDPLCISYVSTTPMNSLTFDLNKFIQDSVTNGYGITNDMYLSIVFAGFEIWGGGDGLNLKQFCAQVN